MSTFYSLSLQCGSLIGSGRRVVGQVIGCREGEGAGEGEGESLSVCLSVCPYNR